MRIIFLLTLTLFFTACRNECALENIDNKVNLKLTQTFENEKSGLWKNLENEFYNRLTELNLLNSQKDSLEAFKNLMIFITEQGFPPEFFIDPSDTETQVLLKSLKNLGIETSDETAQTFLFNQISPIIKACNNEFNFTPPRDLLIAYGITDPDSLKFSYDLSANEFYKIYSIEDLKRPGLYKTLLLFYFSRMMNPKRFN